MYGWNPKYIIRSLKDSLVVTESEVIHVKQVYNVVSVHHFSSQSSSYKEINLQVEAISYSLYNDQIQKQEIHNILITVNTSQIIHVTKDNIALLLLDDCKLVREASHDWYKKKAS